MAYSGWLWRLRRRISKRKTNKKKKIKNVKPIRSCNWLELPRDVTIMILQKAGPFEILMNAQFVCKYWHTISLHEPSLWTRINVTDLDLMAYYDKHDDYNQANPKIEAMIREAVNRSRGGLVDLNLEQFLTAELLSFVTQRCTKIRRLRVAANIDELKLGESLMRLPLLEDLDRTCSYRLDHHPESPTLKFIGRVCPRLTSLKWNYKKSSAWTIPSNRDAKAIARTMPQLRRLQLIGNQATNKGVRAILDACPNLESLDLRGSYFVRLKTDIRERCSGWIDNLRGPFDEFDEDVDVPHYDPNDYTWLQELGDGVNEVDDDASSVESFIGMQVGRDNDGDSDNDLASDANDDDDDDDDLDCDVSD